MPDDVYFDGDPATESARRHMERVLKEPERRRRWPWIVAGAAAVAAWYFWPRERGETARKDASASGDAAKPKRGAVPEAPRP